MSLIKCIDCGSDISKYSTSCPKCGCPTSLSIELLKYSKEESGFSKIIFLDHQTHDDFSGDWHKISLELLLTENRKSGGLIIREEAFPSDDFESEEKQTCFEFVFSIKQVFRFYNLLGMYIQNNAVDIGQRPIMSMSARKTTGNFDNQIDLSKCLCKIEDDESCQIYLHFYSYNFAPFACNDGFEIEFGTAIPVENAEVIRREIGIFLKLLK